MKYSAILLLAGGMLIPTAPAQALSCDQQAAICVQKGGPRAKCYASVASCNRTGTYVGSDGRSWDATPKQKTPKYKKSKGD